MRHYHSYAGAALAITILAQTTSVLMGQAQAQGVAGVRYEVAAIKPNKSGDATVTIAPNVYGLLTVRNASLVRLIQSFFSMPAYRIVGATAWMDSEKYDIEARAPTPKGSYDLEQIREMTQGLLVDRFKLAVHRESRELPLYVLEVAKGGPKLKEANGSNCFQATLTSKPADAAGLPLCGRFAGRPGDLHGLRIPLAMLAGQLEQLLGRPVRDESGLRGKDYDIDLKWNPVQLSISSPSTNPVDDRADAGGPSIFTALQEQLGLRLESRKGPVEVLVIDSADRPSDN